ncbi:hypothetical protein [Vibrio phage phiKT1024]|nr:hypothetical protein [Vibrio phage phiKT1024]
MKRLKLDFKEYKPHNIPERLRPLQATAEPYADYAECNSVRLYCDSTPKKVLLETQRKNHLIHQIEKVKSFLNNIGFGQVPFTVCGGSVFIILQCMEYSHKDIDVYFTNKSDVKRFIQYIEENEETIKSQVHLHSTSNALTFSDQMIFDISPKSTSNKINLNPNINIGRLERDIQFIIRKFGTPQSIFDTFDFNCSMCGVTSDYELVLDDRFNKEIKYIEGNGNFHNELLNRYLKYISEKGAIDPDYKTVKRLIKEMLINKDEELVQTYNEQTVKKSSQAILNLLYQNPPVEISDYVHDCVVDVYDDESTIVELYELFYPGIHQLTKCNMLFNLVRMKHKEENPTDPYGNPHDYEAYKKLPKITEVQRREVILAYPEYFL